MVVTTEYASIQVDGSAMRTLVVTPAAAGTYPGILCYSDIFQLTGPHVRACQRLAGYGFVVAAPEIYHRTLPAGTVIPFDDAGRTLGLDQAKRTPVRNFDADARAVLDHLGRHPRVRPGQLGVLGFCIGGHLAFRGALQPAARATVCYYPTGMHDGELGADRDAGSLARAKEIKGELLLVFGTNDPHVPPDARTRIEEELRRAGTRVSVRLYPAEHAFMRDEGARYDPEATDHAYADAVTLFRRVFAA
jgi:carboxymethylenebutenolidase